MLGSGHGAYGLTVPDVRDVDLLTPAPEHWLQWRFRWDPVVPAGPQSFDSESAFLRTEPSGMASISRADRTTVLHVPDEPGDEALAHPYLALTAVLNAAWNGDVALHGGSFVLDGRVWAVIGDREFGKSSALAWLASHGILVAGDDLVITDGSVVRTGPRCLDLRRSAADRFGMGTYVGQLGSRERWRVRLGAIEPELPFAGWVSLAWGPAVRVAPLPMRERVPVLTAARGLRLPTSDAMAGLRVVAAPAFVFERPQDWSFVDIAMSALVETLGAV